MRLLAAAAVAGLAFSLVRLPAGAASPSDAPGSSSLGSPLTFVDISITNAGPVTSCPLALKLEAHIKNADVKAASISYVFAVTGGPRTRVVTMSIPAGSTVSVTDAIGFLKAIPEMRKGTVSIEAVNARTEEVIVGKEAPKSVNYTATCPTFGTLATTP